MSRRGLIYLAVSALVLTAAFAGCGGSDAQPLTKAEFHAKAKALCKERSKQYFEEALAASRELEKGGHSRSAIEVRVLEQTVIPGMERKMGAVRALEPPPADAAQVDRILTAIEEVVELAKANPQRFIYLQWNFKRPFHESNELAKEYGLSACARV
jgi:hypothetical protein